ncbi:uncharacterized protein LOC136032059 [Artemia franciscana]|uniref:Uncharacterized protein n=1 Tax=Artemia franciscana TaxID=6661 RepID=A0AA88ICF0_ARTSF|nr:hypothetical protein QYM36_000460 [Artemia franciscana]
MKTNIGIGAIVAVLISLFVFDNADGMFIRVTETEFSDRICYLDGINTFQLQHLETYLSLLQPLGQISLLSPSKICAYKVEGMTALQLMSFFKEQYEAKIVAHSSGKGKIFSTYQEMDITSWTLESLEK